MHAEFDDVAGFEVERRLLPEAYAGRRARADNVSGEKGHELADVAHDGWDLEDHLCCGAVLQGFPVDGQPHGQGMWVRDLVLCREEGPEGSEGVAAFSFHPLSASFQLPLPFAVIVMECVPGDVVQSVGLAHIGGFFSDDDGELHFPVRFLGVSRDDEIVVGAAQG